MPVNDPVGDMLTRLRNGSRAHHAQVVMPASRVKVGSSSSDPSAMYPPSLASPASIARAHVRCHGSLSSGACRKCSRLRTVVQRSKASSTWGSPLESLSKR